VALRSTDWADPDADKESDRPVGDALDRIEPPAADNGTLLKWVAFAASSAFSIGVWILQLLFLLALYWNSPLSTRTIGGKTAHAWGAEYAPKTTNAIDLGSSAPHTYPVYSPDGNVTFVPIDPTPPWQPRLPPSYFQLATALWVAGMLINVAAIGAYVARAATPTLRHAISERFSLTSALFTFSAISPEAVSPLADRRRDVLALRMLGLVPAWCLDFPILVVALALLGVFGYHDFVCVVAVASGAHQILYCYRAVLVAITNGLRRPPTPPEQRADRWTLSAAAVLVATLVHLGLMCALLGLYLHGFYYGVSLGMSADSVDALRTAFWCLLVVLLVYVCSHAFVGLAVLNHFVFTDATFADNSWRGTAVLLLGSLDASWINCLSQSEEHVREIRRVANLLSLVWLYAPAMLLQGAIVFMADVDWSYLDNSENGRLIDGQATSNAALAFTVLIGVGKMLVYTYLQTAQREAMRDAQNRGEAYERAFKLWHPPWSKQWLLNREPPPGWHDPDAPGRSPYGYTVTGARHCMGYALTDEGDWMLDEDGNCMLADGVSYAVDAYGDYVLDENGDYVLEGLVENPEGDQDASDYWYGAGEDVTNTSRSTDTFTASDSRYGGSNYGADGGGGGVSPAEMLQITCARRSLFENPEQPGTQGFFLALPTSAAQPTPFLFVPVHEAQPKRKSFGSGSKGTALMSVTFLSLDAANLARDYIERNVAKDPEAAWQQLQAHQDDGLAVDGDADANAYGGGGHGGYGGYGGGGHGGYGGGGYESGGYADANAYDSYADQPLPPPVDEDPNTAQRL